MKKQYSQIIMLIVFVILLASSCVNTNNKTNLINFDKRDRLSSHDFDNDFYCFTDTITFIESEQNSVKIVDSLLRIALNKTKNEMISKKLSIPIKIIDLILKQHQIIGSDFNYIDTFLIKNQSSTIFNYQHINLVSENKLFKFNYFFFSPKRFSNYLPDELRNFIDTKIGNDVEYKKIMKSNLDSGLTINLASIILNIFNDLKQDREFQRCKTKYTVLLNMLDLESQYSFSFDLNKNTLTFETAQYELSIIVSLILDKILQRLTIIYQKDKVVQLKFLCIGYTDSIQVNNILFTFNPVCYDLNLQEVELGSKTNYIIENFVKNNIELSYCRAFFAINYIATNFYNSSFQYSYKGAGVDYYTYQNDSCRFYNRRVDLFIKSLN